MKVAMSSSKSSRIPLHRAVFEFWKSTHDGECCVFDLNYTSSIAPKTITVNDRSQTFKIDFPDGSCFEAKPWQFLSCEQLLPAHAIAAALVHTAVGAVWDSFRGGFDDGVSRSAVGLFGRFENIRAPFEPVAADLWSHYVVKDWESGTAVAADGSHLYSLHANLTVEESARAGPPPQYDQAQINGAVLREVKKRGLPSRDGEVGWQTMANVEKLIAEFCLKTMSKEPARSTLQKLAKAAIAQARIRTGS